MGHKNIKKITPSGITRGDFFRKGLVFMTYPKIKKVKALENWKLSVLFVNEIKKIYDILPLFEEFPDMFEPLRQNPSIFPHVSVDCGGCAIAWNEDIDIPESELWENGVTIPKPIGDSWDDVRAEISTPEEITENNLRVDLICALIEARNNQGITQKKLEELSGVKQPVIARMEKGKSNPQIDTVLKILRPLGLTLTVVPLE